MPYFHLPSLVNRWLHAVFSIHSPSIRRSGLGKKRALVLCYSLFWRRLLRILSTQPCMPTGPVPLSVGGGWGISHLTFPASFGEVCGTSQATHDTEKWNPGCWTCQKLKLWESHSFHDFILSLLLHKCYFSNLINLFKI